jgi:hypothetical protein
MLFMGSPAERLRHQLSAAPLQRFAELAKAVDVHNAQSFDVANSCRHASVPWKDFSFSETANSH